MLLNWILTIIMLLATMDGYCNPCGPPGKTDLFQQNDKQGYFLQRSIAKRSLFLQFPGKSFLIDRNTPDYVNAFTLDGIYYQSLTTSTDIFKNTSGPTTHAVILANHAKWEYEATKKSPSPLTHFEDLGNRERPASPGTPELTFKLWRIYSPTNSDTSQYFLSTVVDDEVVILSAVVSKMRASESNFFHVTQAYTSAFRYLRKSECQGMPTKQ